MIAHGEHLAFIMEMVDCGCAMAARNETESTILDFLETMYGCSGEVRVYNWGGIVE